MLGARGATKHPPFLLLLMVLLVGCGAGREPVPPGVVPTAPRLTQQDIQQGEQTRDAIIAEYPVARDPAARQRVERIVEDLSRAANSRDDFWVTLLEGDHIQNAAATRGNQIFIWTGMLRAVQGDSELAAILAHETAHIIAGHVIPTQEELLRQIAAQLAGVGASRITGDGSLLSSQVAGNLATQAARGFLVNPYSRELEHEADVIGLFLMADAGYDPRAALDFWRRSEGSGIALEFLATHPPSAARQERLVQFIPEAMQRYRS